MKKESRNSFDKFAKNDGPSVVLVLGILAAIFLGVFVGLISSRFSSAGTYTMVITIIITAVAFVITKARAQELERIQKQEDLIREAEHKKQQQLLQQEHKAKIDAKKLRLKSIYETIGGADVSIIYNWNQEKRIVVNEKNQIIVIDEEVFDWSDIISFDIKDNRTVCTSSFTTPGLAKTTTDTGSMLGRAVVGGLVSGGIGAVIGGATASKTTTIRNGKTTTTSETTHDYSINITVNRIKNPIITIPLGPKEDLVEQIAGVLSVIINQNNQADSVEDDKSNSTPSVADELAKLADLRDKGILTDEEFQTQKAKLLR